MSKAQEATTKVYRKTGAIGADERFDRIEESVEKLIGKLDQIIEKISATSGDFKAIEGRLSFLEKVVYTGLGIILCSFLVAMCAFFIKAQP